MYRRAAIDVITELGEQENVALTQTAFNSVRTQLVDYLTSVAGVAEEDIGRLPVAERLGSVIEGIMHGTGVVRVKMYNQQGTVVFSTTPSQIGSNQSDNEGWASAIDGRVASELVYRDTFNRFDKADEDDNLVQTYIPVRRNAASPILGVFETYTYVNDLVHRTEETLFLIIVTAVVVLSLLYLLLLLIVLRAEKIIVRQQDTIKQRTEAPMSNRQYYPPSPGRAVKPGKQGVAPAPETVRTSAGTEVGGEHDHRITEEHTEREGQPGVGHLHRLFDQFVTAQERQRTQLASELHDGVV